MKTKTKPTPCSICGTPLDGAGRPAAPINDALCCDSCYAKVVIPRKLLYLTREDAASKPATQA